jgi:hypothetical protein
LRFTLKFCFETPGEDIGGVCHGSDESRTATLRHIRAPVSTGFLRGFTLFSLRMPLLGRKSFGGTGNLRAFGDRVRCSDQNNKHCLALWARQGDITPSSGLPLSGFVPISLLASSQMWY